MNKTAILCAMMFLINVLAGCAREATPDTQVFVQTFYDNETEFTRSIDAIDSMALTAKRVEIREDHTLAKDIVEMFSLQPMPVNSIVVYPTEKDRLIVTYRLYSRGLSIGGESFTISYNSNPSDRPPDPAVTIFPDCSGVNLVSAVRDYEHKLSAECTLAEGWTLDYTAN